MSADRETRRRLEEVQQRLAGIEAEVALEESPGFSDELRELEKQLDLARGRAQRGEERLLAAQREHEAAAEVVRELELAAQAKQSNHIDDVVGAVTGFLLIAIIASVGWIFRGKQDLPLQLLVAVGSSSAASLGAVLRARVVRPKPKPKRE